MSARGVLRLPGRGVRAVLLGLLWVYQNAVSPLLGPRCRYYPSCSNYAVQALRTHGAAKGTALAVARVCRCHPWSAGGVDRVPPPGRWRPDPEPPSELTAFPCSSDGADGAPQRPGRTPTASRITVAGVASVSTASAPEHFA